MTSLIIKRYVSLAEAFFFPFPAKKEPLKLFYYLGLLFSYHPSTYFFCVFFGLIQIAISLVLHSHGFDPKACIQHCFQMKGRYPKRDIGAGVAGGGQHF